MIKGKYLFCTEGVIQKFAITFLNRSFVEKKLLCVGTELHRHIPDADI